MANLELVEVSLEGHGFSFYVVNLPDDQIDDALALVSPPSGYICQMEYQNYLFNTLIVNVERLFLFIAESSGGDPDVQIHLRDMIEVEIYKVNPKLDPENLVITKSGIIKVGPDSSGVPLKDIPEWDRIIEDLNPYIILEEFDIIPEPPDFSGAEENKDNEFIDRFETTTCNWKRANIELKIRKFSKNDLNFIFGNEVSFQEPIHYKIHIIQKCVEKADSVFALCDAMGLTAEVTIPVLSEELYQLCVSVNPFLKAEEVDLEEIRKNKKTKDSKKRRQSSKKKGSGKKFSEVTKDELLTLSARMNSKIVGQEESVNKIVDTIQIASCGLRDVEAPIAVYLMCGTTGVGKTLLAKILAEELCGSKENMVRIDCSEYTQQHDVQKLIGAPPSFVGYEDGGFLTNAVQDNPFSIVLFDEIEKAHSKLFDLLLQIMDDARLTDGKGNVTSFRDCIILMTSNIGVSESEAVKSTMGFGDDAVLTEDKRERALKEALKNRFRPEFLNRIDETLSFRSLNQQDALKVIDLLLDKVKGYLTEKNITADFTDNVKQMIFSKGFSKKYGARPLQRAIDREVIKSLAKMLLRGDIKEGTHIKVDYVKEQLAVKEIKLRSPRKKKVVKV